MIGSWTKRTGTSLFGIAIILGAFGTILPTLFEEAHAVEFATPRNLSHSDATSQWPAMAAYGSNVYVAYTEGDFSSANIYFAKSTNSGVDYTTPINITTNTGDTSSIQPALSVQGSNLYLAFSEIDGGADTSSIKFTRSTDGGVTFSQLITISGSQESTAGVSIASAGKYVYAVWFNVIEGFDEQIFFARSLDYGKTFTAPMELSGVGANLAPVVAATGKSVFVAWGTNRDGTFHVDFVKSTDAGVHFSSPKDISGQVDIISHPASTTIAANGKFVYVGFSQLTSEGTQIYLTRSKDGGNTFSIPLKVGGLVDTSSGTPRLALSTTGGGKIIYLAWNLFDALGSSDNIYVSKSTNYAETFGSADPLSTNGERVAGAPAIATSGSSAFIAWAELDETAPQTDVWVTKTI